MKGRLSNKIEINWKPDKSSSIPLYMQIVIYFKEKIKSNEWGAAHKIPSQRDLAMLFEVNRSTINFALEELVALGVLKTEIGRGTFIEDDSAHKTVREVPPRARGIGRWNTHDYNGHFLKDSPPNIKLHERKNEFIHLGSDHLSEELIPISLIENSFMNLDNDSGSLNHLPPNGHYGLRKEIAKKLSISGINVTAQNILITSGSAQALNIISLALLNQNARIYTENPSDIDDLGILQYMDVSVSAIKFNNNRINSSSLLNNKKKKDLSLLYIIPSSQNRGDSASSKVVGENLLDQCLDNNISIIEDNSYQDLWLDEKPPTSLMVLDKVGTVLYLGSVSKTLFEDIGLGWIVGPEPVIDRLSEVKQKTDYSTSPISQIIVKRLFQSGAYNSHVIELRRVLKKRRDSMIDLLNLRFKDIGSWKVSEHGYFIWLKLNKKENAKKLFGMALDKNLLLEHSMEFLDEEIDEIRLSYSAVPESEMEEALNLLRKVLSSS